jgi:hypothetical protein
VDLSVTKTGYGVWRKTGAVEPGQRLEAALSKRVLLTVTALAEEYGQESGIPGVIVTLNNKRIAKTDAKVSRLTAMTASRARRRRSHWRHQATYPRRGRHR